MIFAILPVVLIVALVMLIMKRNGTKVSFVKFDYYLRKSKLGIFLEFVFLLAVVLGCMTSIKSICHFFKIVFITIKINFYRLQMNTHT